MHRRQSVAELFKFAFDSNPWDRQVSFDHHVTGTRTCRRRLMPSTHDDTHAGMEIFDIYSIGGDVAVDFIGASSLSERI